MRHMITDKDMSNPHEFIEVMQDPEHSQSDDSDAERCYNNTNNREEADSVYGTLEYEDEDEGEGFNHDVQHTYVHVSQTDTILPKGGFTPTKF